MLQSTIKSVESIQNADKPGCAQSSKAGAASSCAMKLDSFKVACSSCNLRELCLPVGLSQPQLSHLDSLVATRRSVKREIGRAHV